MVSLVFSLQLLISACLVAMIWAPYLIRPLRKYASKRISKVDRPLIYDIHKTKIGTPSMGGILFILNIFLFTFFLEWSWEMGLAYLTIFLYGTLGCIDDYLGTYGKGKIGLKWWHKMLLQLLFAAIISYLLYENIPGVAVVDTYVLGRYDLDFLFVPFMTFIIVATANAVNITDGLDGLASGLSIFNFLALFVISIFLYEQTQLSLYQHVGDMLAVVIGSIVAFLWYNIYPARIFMGDVGSMVIGALLAYFAALTQTVFLIPVVGGLFVLELLSSLGQMISLRFFKRRILKLSPLHHHYEALGWHETQVVMRMWLIGLMLSLVGLFMFFASFAK